VRFAWGAAVEPDPYTIWHSSQIKEGGNNFISYSHPRVDEICEQIREEFDPLTRWQLAREMHAILADEQPVFFQFAFTEQYFYPQAIRGVYLYPSSYPVNYREWWWADEARRSEKLRTTVATGN
jgi:peptide/nickel transport system substrate-binding protein